MRDLLLQRACGDALLLQVDIPGGGSISIKDYLAQSYNYRTSFIGPVYAILCAFMVFFGALAILSLKMINYQRR